MELTGIVSTGDRPLEITRMKINRFPAGYSFQSEENLKEAMDKAHEANLDMRDALCYWVMFFYKTAQEERQAVRNEIMAGRDPRLVKQYIQTSRMVLIKTDTYKGSRLRWEEIWFHGGSKFQGKRKPMFNYIKRTKTGGYNIATLLKGAHPDEFEMLKRHEKERLALDVAWKNLHRLELDLEMARRQVVREIEVP